MSQATNLAVAEHGPMSNWDGFTSRNNGPEMQHWFDKYLKPYLNIVDEYIETIEGSGDKYLVVHLADGGIATFSNYAANTPDIDEETGKDKNNSIENFNGLIHVAYLTNPNGIDIKNRKECVNTFKFLFYSSLKKQYFFQPYTYNANTPEKYNREFFIKKIKEGNPQYCSALMMSDGWEIKEDYPW